MEREERIGKAKIEESLYLIGPMIQKRHNRIEKNENKF